MSTVEQVMAPEVRIVNGRYMIPPPAGGKPKAHTRVTNFAKIIDDTYNLQRYGQRMVALGLAADASLIEKVKVLGPDDKEALNDLAEAAKAAAGANDKRDRGTEEHALCERLDRGETFTVPSWAVYDLQAYETALDRCNIVIDPAYIEGVVVNPTHGTAGRFDRLVWHEGKLKVADIKTGSIDFALLSIAIQLAEYANAETLYDPSTETHSPMPEVDRAEALILHLPSGEGRCDVYRLDIARGWEAAKLCAEVRAIRRSKNLAMLVGSHEAKPDEFEVGDSMAPIDGEQLPETASSLHQETPDPGEHPDVAALREWITAGVRRIIDAGHGPELAKEWPSGVQTLKASQDHDVDALERVKAAVELVEGRHRMEFREPDPRSEPMPEAKVLAAFPGTVELPPDEGETINDAELDRIRADLEALPAEAGEFVAAVVKQAYDDLHSVSLRQKASERRALIASALIRMAVERDPWRALADAIATVTGERPDEVQDPGAYVGRFTLSQARAFFDHQPTTEEAA